MFRKIDELLNEKRSFVTAVIYNSSGSSPRTSGAKMIITEDGNFYGTIGGGSLEAITLNKAHEVFESKMGQVLYYNLKGKKDLDMICGGEAYILLYYVDSTEIDKTKIFKEACSNYNSNIKSSLVTVFDKELCISRHYISSDVCEMKTIENGDDITIYEPIYNKKKVYIFGAGHVSQKLSFLTAFADFNTVIIDDRKEFASRERFPYADELIVIEGFKDFKSEIIFDKDSYIVIVTRGHQFDYFVLKSVLKSEAAYIGMIGSKKKREEIYNRLLNDGFEEKDLQFVHSPIGLAINAQTPEEIAISIIAELVDIRGNNI